MNEACIRQLEEVTRDRPRHADAWFVLGAVRHAVVGPEAALVDFETALALNPNYVDAAIARAFALAELGRPREGYASLRPLLCVAPDDFALVFGSGIFAMRQGWIDTGVSQLRRAVALLPSAPFARAFLSAALEQTGEAAAAVQSRAECERLTLALDRGTGTDFAASAPDHAYITTWPAPARMHAALAGVRFLQQSGDRVGAAGELAALHARYPGHPHLLCEAGRLAAIVDDDSTAERCLRAAIAVHPGCHQAMVESSFILARLDRIDDALGMLREAVSLRPFFPDYRRHLGTLLLDLGRTTEAIEQLEQAHILNQQDGHTALRLAMAYIQAERWVDAQLMLDSGDWREWVEAQVLQADSKLHVGDVDGARDLLTAVLGSDPGHPAALELLEALGA